uniref:Uncharacterized protein n=1 Tax=Nicotiana tabacum TaxID=4097 RepID=A0A1S3ZY93_TOBAC|nr:PREDICTED: uncharacterized protein LOC107791763 [Nicotiana tabacum]XP_018634106.1 uncharacterized protein LOC104119104 [Nicotiana tomentosiformis]
MLRTIPIVSFNSRKALSCTDSSWSCRTTIRSSGVKTSSISPSMAAHPQSRFLSRNVQRRKKRHVDLLNILWKTMKLCQWKKYHSKFCVLKFEEECNLVNHFQFYTH